ncbi:MAG: hypothetical protein JWO77_681 [Ilumatobacteraceae bacterium]|nr:hypothetical protein [Ilumatobacteraceae bacterium]
MLPTSHHRAARPGDATPSTLRRLGERGAGLVEYALLMALVAVVCVAALVFFGGETNSNFTKSGSTIEGR